jgi:hypothetical protein
MNTLPPRSNWPKKSRWHNTELTPEAKKLIRALYRKRMPICDIVKKVLYECEIDVNLLDVDQEFVGQYVTWVIIQSGQRLTTGNWRLL